MTQKIKHVLILFSLLLSLPVLALSAQDEGAVDATEANNERIVELYSSPNTALRFNVPIPTDAGWVNRSSDELAHFQNTALGADIYVTALDGTDLSAGSLMVLNDVIGDEDFELITSSEINLGGTRWLQQIYTLPDGRDITVFGGLRDTDDIYVLVYVNNVPAVDYHMLIVQQAEDGTTLEENIAAGIAQLGITTVEQPDSTDTVLLSNGEWTRQVFSEGDLRLLAQERPGNATYLVMEQGGDGALMDAVNKQFFTVFLGFFVTPNNDPYFWLGLVVSLGLVLGLVATYGIRRRNLKKDIALIEQLREE